ncbi:MAG: aminotransferase class I and II [Edaphobacter sp.]|uniref:HipA family kinase n=1 Tax=Edaphobacter sp. TaxID=1934404 RepID=UPI002384ED2A|nr:HipA family kinase [Edaphobacter sp.]MDE1178653.1 aminotransferase class I and II [Edaphobacter sp.]
MQLRTIRATQYVTALREGGSLPAIVAADDFGMYVVKFRGAGQGPLALVAELVAGEIGRALGLNVPELVFVEVDAALGRNEPDQEIRELLKASIGLNLALDYLPGSTMFDHAAGDKADAKTASLAVWFDAFVMNVDRTPRNANLLVWHRELYFIDHGAAIYVHHDWESMPQRAESPFRESKNHVLLPWATQLEEADATARRLITADKLAEILEAVPGQWLTRDNDGISAAEKRAVYLDFFTRRLAASAIFVKEAADARHQLV